MSCLLQLLHTDHSNFDRLLALLDRQLELLHRTEPADLELMHDVMHYMTNYPDHVHHPREGAMFRHLLERDPSAAALLGSIGAEHQQLADKGIAFRDTLKHCVDGAMVRRELLEAQGRDYVASLRRHMEHEDGEAFPLARKLLESADWEAIDQQLEQREDPIFGSVVEEQYRSLLEFINRQDGAG